MHKFHLDRFDAFKIIHYSWEFKHSMHTHAYNELEHNTTLKEKINHQIINRFKLCFEDQHFPIIEGRRCFTNLSRLDPKTIRNYRIYHLYLDVINEITFP